MTAPLPAPDSVAVVLTRADAELITWGMSDALCWHAGFMAARLGTGLEGHEPMGFDQIREMKIKIERAMK